MNKVPFSCVPASIFARTAKWCGGLLKIFKRLPKEEREYLYSIINESLNSGIPLSGVLDELSQGGGSSPNLIQFSRTAKRGVLEKNDFTYFLDSTGFLPDRELQLLKIGSKMDSLELICTYLLDQYKSAFTFNRECLAKAGKHIGGVPLSIVVTIYASDLLGGMRKATETPPLFFKVADFTEVWWPFMFGVPLVLFLVHRYLLTRVSVYRPLFHRFGMFSLYDKEQEIQLCNLLSALIPTRIPTIELLQALTIIFRKNIQLQRKICGAYLKVSEEDLIDIFHYFLNPATVSKVRSKAPLGTPEQIGPGFKFAARIISLRHKTEVNAYVMLITAISMLITGFFVIPLTMMVSGLTM